MVKFDLASIDFLIPAAIWELPNALDPHRGDMMEVEKKEERVLPTDWVAKVLLTKEAQEVGIEALKDCFLHKWTGVNRARLQTTRASFMHNIRFFCT